VNNISLFSSFLIFILIGVILLLNDKMNFIYIVINLILGISYSLLIKPYLGKDESDITKKEEKIKRSKDKLESFTLMNEARNISYKYINKHYAYKYIVIALEIGLAFIMMMHLSLASISYIICYSVLQIYLYNNIVSILTKTDDIHKQDNLLNKIINITKINSHNDY
ncbi:MAG: hypothetical protein K5906_00705, partial [Bacilli bacterium]|nr:hypothetical protein [Bacilli bacterium]